MRTSVFILTLFFASSLFAAGHDLTTSPPTANQLQPVVTGNGSGFTAAWIEQALGRNTVVSSVVNANGEPIVGGSTAVDQKSVSSIAIAHSPSDALIAWTAADGNLFAERLSPSGMPLGTTLVTFGKDYASDVAVAWNGNRYFVVWSHGVQFLGAFVASDGSATTPRVFFSEPVQSGQPPGRLPVTPDVAWDGRQFIVVFGEVPNVDCTQLCPSYPPDRFRVMRVSADGDAIDSPPLVITGSHLRAHVATNGTESLIALDGSRDVSTIIAHTEGGLTLDAETPIFRWVSDVASAVVWDGAMFRVGWKYAGADANWIGAAQVTRSGQPFDYRVTAAGALAQVWWGEPSMAVNEAGATAFVVSEAVGRTALARARLYLSSEFAPMPAPPPAPRNVVSYFGGNTARIDWQQSETPAGFVLEWSWDFGKTWGLFQNISGNARTTSVHAAVGNLFRVRAFGAGGVSEGTITSIGSMQRRRAQR